MTRCVLTILAAVGIAAPTTAFAAQGGGSVTGTVQLADPARRPHPPERNHGFVPRAANAIKPPRADDPLPDLVVVLEGGSPADEDTQPPGQPVRYTIIGESFDVPVLPVVAGSLVEIRNAGRNSPRLYSPDAPNLVPSDPVSPKGERKTKKVGPAGKSFAIRDRESAHLRGRILALPSRYFSRVDDDGKFEIKDVAPGSYTVKVWYRDGWVEMSSQKVDVSAHHDAKVKLPLPAHIATKAPGKAP